MGILLFSWIFFMPLCSSFFGMHVALVSGECLSDGRVCLEDEMLLLLQLKSTLKFNADASNKLVSWNQSADCCSWGGVTWDATGHVVALDLSSEFISGGFYSSSSIFSLQYLQSLNLANNTFFSSEIPSGFDKLGNLTYLNLSKAGFSGQIPIEISRLTRLVTIDISSFNDLFGTPTPKLEQPKLRMLVQNLKELRELHLDGVDISAQGKEWCQALSSFVPNLRVLSLSRYTLQILDLSNNQLLWVLCQNFLRHVAISVDNPQLHSKSYSIALLGLILKWLTGSIPSFRSSKNLTHINLSRNYFYWSDNFPSLGKLFESFNLDLHQNLLHGDLPLSLFSHPSLQKIQLNQNQFSGQLNEFSVVSSFVLEVLDLSSNNLQGSIPLSVFDLRALRVLELSFNNVSGTLELSKFQELGNLTTLSLSTTKSICNATNVQVLDLSDNALSGEIPSCLIENEALAVLNLRRNMDNSRICSQLQELEVFNLGKNRIDDKFPCWLKNMSSLRVLVLRANRFHGPIGCPNSNSTWPMLQIVDLAYNNFSGKLPAKGFLTWKAMMASEDEDAVTVTSKGQEMELVKVLTLFTSIDFSSNKFEGQIPEEMGNFISLYVLNYLVMVSQANPIINGAAETARVIRPLTQPSEWEDPHRACEPNFPFSPGPLLQSVSGGNPKRGCTTPTFDDRHSASRMEIKWEYIAPEIGFVTGLGIVIWPLVFAGDGGNATTNVLIEFFQGFSITKTKEQVVEEELTEFGGGECSSGAEGFSYQSESISINEKVVYLGLISINFW
ncbi:Receptor-like protein 12 [Vitis vinifera]|uniref:Receptor-like protein 12 n=1 Tax=Vitis vinifera TaxID=29760 RepID=A0A438CJC6_VITVI|nr:Receptor-like protein 12 [Vitis vinifera]